MYFLKISDAYFKAKISKATNESMGNKLTIMLNGNLWLTRATAVEFIGALKIYRTLHQVQIYLHE